MSRIGRLLALILALAGFAAARALAPAGHAQVPLPTVTVTTPSLPAPLPPPPTVTIAPTVSTPTVTTPPAPAPPPVAISPPPAPVPPPVQITPTPTPRVTPPPTTTDVAPTSSAPASTPAPSSGSSAGPSAGSSAGSSSAPAPAGAAAPSQTSGGASSSSSGSGAASSSTGNTGGRAVSGRPSSTTRTRALAAKTYKTKSRVSVRLRFALPAAGRLFLVVRGPAPSCRVAGVVPVRGRKGTNTVFFSGRVQGRRLEPGVYQLSLSSSRRPQPAAPATTVRVVSPRRSVPVTTPARSAACAPAQAFFDDGTTRILEAEAQQQRVPIAKLAAAPNAALRPALPSDGVANGEDEEAAGLVPDPGSDSADGGLESFAAIAVLLIVASLLLGMVALVTRFLRGSWDP